MSKKRDDTTPKRLKAVEKRARAANTVRLFAKQYGRKAQKGIEPNDRRYDRKIERTVRHMKPDKLDKLLHGDED
jgi:hypothetical protein